MNERLFDINRHGALKAPLSLWFCTGYLLRHWLLVLVIATSWFTPSDNIAWVFGLLSWQMLVAESPLLLLVLAGIRRVPEGGAWARILWRRGRELISLTAVLSIGWAVWYLAGQPVWSPVPERLVAAMALIDGAILIGVWREPHYREVFQDFPAPAPAGPRAT